MAESKKKKGSFQLEQSLRELLALPVAEEQELQRAAAAGLDTEGLCNGKLLLLNLLDNAKSGNMTALKEILSLLDKGRAAEEGVKIVDDV